MEFDDDRSSNSTFNKTFNNAPINSGANCEPPANWYRCTLRFGDTLSALAVAPLLD
jgi:hypothetical protein